MSRWSPRSSVVRAEKRRREHKQHCIPSQVLVMDVDVPEEEKKSSASSLPRPSTASKLPRFSLTKSVVTAIGRSSHRCSSSPTTTANARSLALADTAARTEVSDDDDEENPYEYVTHLESNCDGSKLAAALSCREIKLYARDTMRYEKDVMRQGHNGPVTQLAFAPGDPFALFSASEDGTVKGWDTRTSGTSVMSFGQSGEEVWSMALGYDGRLCATGKGRTVDFYDIRKAGEALGTYSECHTDAVTQVAFHPHKHSFLVTGSEDGLMCYLDTAESSEEDALESVMNAECPVRTVGFFGPQREGIYCCSNTETLSLWHAQGAQRITDFGDVRSLAHGDAAECSATATGNSGGRVKGWGVSVDYIVGCRYETQTDRLWLVAGGFGGGACLASVSPDGIAPEGVLERGHREQIRAFDWRGSTVVTGGEDAKVCLWTAPTASSGATESASSRGGAAVVEGAVASGGGVGQSAERRGGNRAGRAFKPYGVDGRKR